MKVCGLEFLDTDEEQGADLFLSLRSFDICRTKITCHGRMAFGFLFIGRKLRGSQESVVNINDIN